MMFIGIDPGESGGIAAIDTHGKVIFACPTPEPDEQVLKLVAGADFAALERVWSSPGWGHAGAFTFGTSYGRLRMALVAKRVNHVNVIPQTWQKVLGVKYPKGAKKVEKKNLSKARAKDLFPKTRITHAIADALLIAEYARRLYQALQA